MGEHIVDGKFKSDKYGWCPAGFFAMKFTDPNAQPLLWKYAESIQDDDLELASDIRDALERVGYVHVSER